MEQEKYRETSSAWDMPPFYRPEYLDLCYGQDEWIGITGMNGGQVRAIWPVGLMNKWGFSRALQHYFTPRSGIWTPGQGKLSMALVEDMIGELPSLNHFHQSFPVNFTGKNAMSLAGFHTEKRITYRLDLTIGEQALWENIRADYRNNKIGKAEGLFTLKKGVATADFHRVHRLTYERQSMPIYYSMEFLDDWYRLIREKAWGETYAAVDQNGNICSVAALLYGESTAWLLMAGDDPQFRKSGSGIWLLWQLIRQSAEEGHRTFDFLGSMVPGIARVRKQFGGIETPYWSFSKTRGVIYPAAKMVFSLFNRG